MTAIGTLRRRLKLGRVRNRLFFAVARARSKGTITAADVPHIERPCHLVLGPGARLVLGRNVRLGRGFTAEIAAGGVLEIGDNTAFNVNCWIGVTSEITIKGDCLVGPYVSFTDGNHAFEASDEPFWKQGYALRPVTVGRNVWIGAKATVINDIGDDTVVGANAVVSKPIPTGVVAGGIPARVLRTLRDGEERPDV